MDNEGVALGSMELAEMEHGRRMPGSDKTLLGDRGLVALHPPLRSPSLLLLPHQPSVRPRGRAGLCAGSWAPKGLQDSAPGGLQCVLPQMDLHGVFRPSPHHPSLERSAPTTFKVSNRHTAHGGSNGQASLMC